MIFNQGLNCSRREVCGQPSTVFQLLQLSILPLGYRLTESAGELVESELAESINRFRKKNQNVKIATKRKQMRQNALWGTKLLEALSSKSSESRR